MFFCLHSTKKQRKGHACGLGIVLNVTCLDFYILFCAFWKWSSVNIIIIQVQLLHDTFTNVLHCGVSGTVFLLLYRYRGEKLDRNLPAAKRRKATRDVIISTIYDKQSEQEDTVLRTAPSTTLKYRDQVQFLRGEVLTRYTDNVDKATSSWLHWSILFCYHNNDLHCRITMLMTWQLISGS